MPKLLISEMGCNFSIYLFVYLFIYLDTLLTVTNASAIEQFCNEAMLHLYSHTNEVHV